MLSDCPAVTSLNVMWPEVKYASKCPSFSQKCNRSFKYFKVNVISIAPFKTVTGCFTCVWDHKIQHEVQGVPKNRETIQNIKRCDTNNCILSMMCVNKR